MQVPVFAFRIQLSHSSKKGITYEWKLNDHLKMKRLADKTMHKYKRQCQLYYNTTDSMYFGSALDALFNF